MKPGIQHPLLRVLSPTWLRCPELGQKTLSLLEHELGSFLRPCAPFPEPLVHERGNLHTRSISELGEKGVLMLRHVQNGRDVNVPESRGLSWSMSAHSMSPIPSCPDYLPSPWGRYHRSMYMSFSGHPSLPRSMALSRRGGTGQCRLYWGQAPPASRAGCQMGASRMEEETSKVGAMRGLGFPGNEQSRRRVSQWWTCSL